MKDFLSVIEGFDGAPSGIPYGVNLFFTVLANVLLRRDFYVPCIDKSGKVAEFSAPSSQLNLSQLFLNTKRNEVIIFMQAINHDQDGNLVSLPLRDQFFTAFEALGGKGGMPDCDIDGLVHISLVKFMPPLKKENLEEIAKAMEILASAVTAAYDSVASS